MKPTYQISRHRNPYPNNPECKRPKESSMRQWCRCMECIKWERKQQGMPTYSAKLRTLHNDINVTK